MRSHKQGSARAFPSVAQKELTYQADKGYYKVQDECGSVKNPPVHRKNMYGCKKTEKETIVPLAKFEEQHKKDIRNICLT